MMTSDVLADGSFDEMLILVDPEDNVIGHESKQKCHDGEGRLHRAFSIFLLNDKNELLLQQRSAQKRLWPLYWSNSVCGHPRKEENISAAASRRMIEELGVKTNLTYLYKFKYKSTFLNKGSENEICSVYYGRFDGRIDPNPSEIQDWRYADLKDLNIEIALRPDHFTPWFRMEWQTIRAEYLKSMTNI